MLQPLREIACRLGSSDRDGLCLTGPMYPESVACSLKNQGPAKQVVWENEEIFWGGQLKVERR